MDSMTAFRPIHRKLSPAKLERRKRFVSSARAIAIEGGYKAVTIDAVCKKAGSTRATLYHYFESKDQLIAEALLEWGHERTLDLKNSPPEGDCILDRIMGMVNFIMREGAKEHRLFSAGVQAMVSPDSGVTSVKQELASLERGYLIAALVGESNSEVDIDMLGTLLGHVYFSSLVNLTAGRTDVETMLADMEMAVQLVLNQK